MVSQTDPKGKSFSRHSVGELFPNVGSLSPSNNIY